jgi:MFS family permease
MNEIPRTSSRQPWSLALVCTAAFMLLLGITIVSVALPSIQRDLHASLPDLQWVSAAYALVLTVLLLSAATLGDRLGRRRLFLVGLLTGRLIGKVAMRVLLGVAMAAAGLASMAHLTETRVLMSSSSPRSPLAGPGNVARLTGAMRRHRSAVPRVKGDPRDLSVHPRRPRLGIRGTEPASRVH